MGTEEEHPYWWPVLVDAAYLAQIRKDYPENTEGMDDDTLRNEYADGAKYADCWDHVGDARDDWEGLADAYFALAKHADHIRGCGIGPCAQCSDANKAIDLALR